MKLTVSMSLDRPDGRHHGKMSFEVDDDVGDNETTAMVCSMMISADVLEGLMFLILHHDDPEHTGEAPAGFVGFDNVKNN